MVQEGAGVEWVDGVPFRRPGEEAEPRENNPGGRDLRAEAARWIAQNPEVAELFLRFARDMASRGRCFGIGLITERVRWEIILQLKDKYKINNNHRAYIARWIIAKDPSVEPFLRFRGTRY